MTTLNPARVGGDPASYSQTTSAEEERAILVNTCRGAPSSPVSPWR